MLVFSVNGIEDVAATSGWSVLLFSLGVVLLLAFREALAPWPRTWWFGEATGRVLETSVSPDDDAGGQPEESDEEIEDGDEGDEGDESELAWQTTPTLAEPFDFLSEQDSLPLHSVEIGAEHLDDDQDTDEEEESEYEDAEYRLEMAEARALEEERLEEERLENYVVEYLVAYRVREQEYSEWVRGYAIPSPVDPSMWDDLTGRSINIQYWRLNPKDASIRRDRSRSTLSAKKSLTVVAVVVTSFILAIVLS